MKLLIFALLLSGCVGGPGWLSGAPVPGVERAAVVCVRGTGPVVMAWTALYLSETLAGSSSSVVVDVNCATSYGPVRATVP